MNILVVDDNEDVREMLEELLMASGHTVYTAEHGKEAIDKLMVYQIDLIITDIIMPEIEGVEFILRLRQSKIPVIAISGLSQERIMQELMKSLGIIGLLQKPFAMKDIADLVAQAEKEKKSPANKLKPA